MNTIGERLLYIIELEEVNLYKYCKKFNFAYSSFNQIVLNKRSLGIQTLYQILETIPNLNINWLLLGTGEVRLIQKRTSEGELIIEEPYSTYLKQDEFEKMLLTYFDRPEVKKAILKIKAEEID